MSSFMLNNYFPLHKAKKRKNTLLSSFYSMQFDIHSQTERTAGQRKAQKKKRGAKRNEKKDKKKSTGDDVGGSTAMMAQTGEAAMKTAAGCVFLPPKWRVFDRADLPGTCNCPSVAPGYSD